MPGKTLVVLGSGPGIGVAVAQNFSVRGFTHVALVSRNGDRLKQDQDQVLEAIQERGYSCQVKTWTCDLADLDALKKTLGEIEGFGSLECVLFNAARVAGKPPLEEDIKAIEADFRLTNLALYEAALWAVPKLQAVTEEDRSPSFFVTSTTQLWKEPVPDLVSLSMVKSAQRALVLSLHNKYGKDVHVALLSIGGVVSPDAKNLSPENIAAKAYALYKQKKDAWEREQPIDE
ncbi:Putative short-chain dehydrogenase/reductase SDR, NAD(P)-binding domain superfamily [Septoria linicola]|uniref:Short-chain dehydrogenase/reductase SDR, NAD(P)-binding domain superfamily n=1 Tax=Septoria linicola TaxID=215465 RepID=A0A9Q9AJP8_9PEZI|nr:putative short-chain dehydrogenase/reductase SDR, NAD(P)-binding domain superfamily [Septoria linicola]USW50617.1 Putative short-chain dehydrogenase/reductase SDR, NAD(P)-binding domain superfamily [Septoria linicola]